MATHLEQGAESVRAEPPWHWPQHPARLRDRYQSALPYPHLVIDDFFDSDALLRLYERLPQPLDPSWIQWGSGGAENCPQGDSKRGLSDIRSMDPAVAFVLAALSSERALADLELICGTPSLIAEGSFNGGGIHCSGRGASLRVHADKVRHPEPARFDQAVNLILFANPHWSPDYGGELELWSRDTSRMVEAVEPRFNRLVLFKADRSTYHGHPRPNRCPPGLYRTSVALYYYVRKATGGAPRNNQVLWV